jgi:hypothetical protein
VAAGLAGEIYKGELCLTCNKSFFFVSYLTLYFSTKLQACEYKSSICIVGCHCINCTNKVADGVELCTACASKQCCVRCTKRKGAHSFEAGSMLCKRCVRWTMNPPRRSALNDTVVEHDLQCFEVDADLILFLARNRDRIIEHITEGLTRHA